MLLPLSTVAAYIRFHRQPSLVLPTPMLLQHNTIGPYIPSHTNKIVLFGRLYCLAKSLQTFVQTDEPNDFISFRHISKRWSSNCFPHILIRDSVGKYALGDSEPSSPEKQMSGQPAGQITAHDATSPWSQSGLFEQSERKGELYLYLENS